MKELAKKIWELVDLLEVKLKETEETIAKHKAQIVTQNEQNAIIAKRIAEIEARESAVKYVEDTVKILEQAKTIATEGQKSLDEANEKIKALSLYQEVVNKEEAAKILQLKDREDKVKVRENNVTAREQKINDLITEKVKEILKQ